MKAHSYNCSNDLNPVDLQYRGADKYNAILSSTFTKLPPRSAIPSSENLKRIWYSKSKTPEEIYKKRNSILRNSLDPSILTRNSQPECGLKVFKTLAILCQKYEIHMSVPETIIIGYGFQTPVLLYTNDKGLLKVQQDLSTSHLKLLIDIFEKYRGDPQQKKIGPLAVKRLPDSKHNRVLMKQSELVLEWKDAYKVDVIIQRYILSKGIKASKIRITMGNDAKIYKIVNRVRQDFKVDGLSKGSTQNGYSKLYGQKTIFSEIAEDNKYKSQISKVQDANRRSSKIKINHFASSNDGSLVNLAKGDNFLKAYSKKDLVKAMIGHYGANNCLLLPESQSHTKKISGVMDYIQSCVGTGTDKSLQELQRSLGVCKSVECDFQFKQEEFRYINAYRDKVNQIFLVKTNNARSEDIYELKQFNSLDKALKMMKELQRTLNCHVFSNNRLRATKLVCDFVEDVHQNIYFIGLKSYECLKLESTPLNRSGISTSSFICPGEYCNDPISSNPSKRNIDSRLFVLRKAISRDKKLSENSLTMPNNRLYEKVQVCKNCFDHYKKRNHSTVPENINSTMSIPKFRDSDVAMIFNQINPNNASHTVMVHKHPSRFMSKSAFTQLNESPAKLNKAKPKQLLQIGTGYKFRKEYFAQKIQEIDSASFEHQFYDS